MKSAYSTFLPTEMIRWDEAHIFHFMEHGPDAPPAHQSVVVVRGSDLDQSDPWISQDGWGGVGPGLDEWDNCVHIVQRQLMILQEFLAIVSAHPEYAAAAHREFLKIPEYALQLPDDTPGNLMFTGSTLIRPYDQAVFQWLDQPVAAIERFAG